MSTGGPLYVKVKVSNFLAAGSLTFKADASSRSLFDRPVEGHKPCDYVSDEVLGAVFIPVSVFRALLRYSEQNLQHRFYAAVPR